MAEKPDEPGDVETDGESQRLMDVHKRAIRRFDEAVIPQAEQRALSLMARRFTSIPGAQWEGEYGEAFENSIKMEVDKVGRGLEKIQRDYRANRIVPDFRPAGTQSDQDTADTLDGLHRADSSHFKSQQARDNAFDEAISGGFGAYRLKNEWADPYDKESDAQRINPALTIVDADQRVFFDPNSKLYDKSDARFAFVLTAKTPDAFKEEHGEDQLTEWPDPKLPLSQWEWYAPDMILVAEYYEIEEKDEKLWVLEHRLTRDEERWWASEISTDELEDKQAMGWIAKSRRQKRARVHKYTMSGQEVLEDHGLIAGSCIPIVPVYGKRWYIDNQERFTGYVQKKMDAQRLYNGKISKLAETDALAPREIPIFAREQMPPNLADLWGKQSVERHAYALVEPLRNEDGSIAIAGPIGKVEPPTLNQVTALLLQAANADLSEDMQEADEIRANVSADAMDIAATRVDAKSELYLDNMRQSVQREGEIYLSMAAEVYVEPGREVETMSEDGDDGKAILQEPVNDNGAFRIRNDFTRGRYKVIADVTEATATRRDKTVKSSLNTAAVATQAGDAELAQVAILTAVMNQDGEGMSEFQAYARKKLVTMGVVKPNEEEQEQMAEAAQNQQPDPTAAALTAQAKELETQAEKNIASAGLDRAKTVETLAKAGQQQQPANDVAAPRPRIRMGRELSA